MAFWLPYNALSMASIFGGAAGEFASDQLYVLQALVHLHSVVSPFLYGFRDD